MLAKTMKWGGIVALLLGAMSWHAGANYWLALNLAVSVGVVVVVRQAVRAKQYSWAFAFVGIALLLNPIAPVFTPAGNLALLLLLLGLAPIAIAFAAWTDAKAFCPSTIIEPWTVV